MIKKFEIYIKQSYCIVWSQKKKKKKKENIESKKTKSHNNKKWKNNWLHQTVPFKAGATLGIKTNQIKEINNWVFISRG